MEAIFQTVARARDASIAAGMPEWAFNLSIMGIKVGVTLGFAMIMTIALIYVERKVWAYMQVRLGPMRVGPKGILQPVADGLKLFFKEDIIPEHADKILFRLAPVIVVVPAIMAYLIIPFGDGLIVKDLNVGILYILAISSVEVLGIIASGWASNNKYSLIGALRGAAQLVSYEIPVIISLCAAILMAGTLSMTEIVKNQQGGFWNWYAFSIHGGFPQIFAAAIYFIGSLAELNRTPFDLPEAESELVAGYNTEYSGMRFAFFFLAEWMNVFLLSCIACTLFFGGWTAPVPALQIGGAIGSFIWFFLKCCGLMFVVIWIRATYPRFRVDQLMEFSWKVLIPLSLANLMITAVAMVLRG